MRGRTSKKNCFGLDGAACLQWLIVYRLEALGNFPRRRIMLTAEPKPDGRSWLRDQIHQVCFPMEKKRSFIITDTVCPVLPPTDEVLWGGTQVVRQLSNSPYCTQHLPSDRFRREARSLVIRGGFSPVIHRSNLISPIIPAILAKALVVSDCRSIL
jgi:hypothetical protein